MGKIKKFKKVVKYTYPNGDQHDGGGFNFYFFMIVLHILFFWIWIPMDLYGRFKGNREVHWEEISEK